MNTVPVDLVVIRNGVEFCSPVSATVETHCDHVHALFGGHIMETRDWDEIEYRKNLHQPDVVRIIDKYGRVSEDFTVVFREQCNKNKWRYTLIVPGDSFIVRLSITV